MNLLQMISQNAMNLTLSLEERLSFKITRHQHEIKTLSAARGSVLDVLGVRFEILPNNQWI